MHIIHSEIVTIIYMCHYATLILQIKKKNVYIRASTNVFLLFSVSLMCIIPDRSSRLSTNLSKRYNITIIWMYMHIHCFVWYWYTSLIFAIKRRFGELSDTVRSRRVIKLSNEVLRWFYVINNTSDSTRERVSSREVDRCISD